jgi:hypothetical protein
VVLYDDSFDLLEGAISGLLFGAAMTAYAGWRRNGQPSDAA